MCARRRGLAGTGVLAVSLWALALAGCSQREVQVSPGPAPSSVPSSTDATGQDPGAAATGAPSEAELVWSTRTTSPASDVANAAGHAIVVATVKGHLEVQELNLADGRVVWGHRVSSSMVPRQVPMPVTVLQDRLVAILEPLTGPGQRARLRLLDVTQRGRAVADTGIFVFTSFPEVCEDDPHRVCAKALEGVHPVEVRLGADGRWSKRPLPEVGDTYEDLGVHGLVRFLEPRSRRAAIGVEQDGRLVWQRFESDLFGRLSPDAGWVFRGQGDVIYGTVRLPRGLPANPMPSRRLTVGLDGRTGATLWRMPGADLGCSSRRDVVLVCEWKAGRVRRDGAVEQGRMVVSRIDPGTGQRLWSAGPFFVAGQDAGALGNSGTGVVVTETTGRTVVDVASGEQRPALPRDITWRTVGIDVPSAERDGAGQPQRTRRALVNRNEPATEPEHFYRPLPPGTGAAFDDLRVVSLAGRVVALRVG